MKVKDDDKKIQELIDMMQAYIDDGYGELSIKDIRRLKKTSNN